VLGLALALVVVGLVVGFFLPPFGFVPAAVGVVLLVIFLAGFGRRAREGRP
jgi:hypothetical protein